MWWFNTVNCWMYHYMYMSPLVYNMLLSKHNGKTVPVHAMNAYQGSKGIASTILSIRIRLRWVVTWHPSWFYPCGKGSPVPTEQKAEWAPESFWMCYRIRKISCSFQELNLKFSSPQPSLCTNNTIPATTSYFVQNTIQFNQQNNEDTVAKCLPSACADLTLPFQQSNHQDV